MEQEQEKSTEMCSENTTADKTPADEQECTVQSAPGVCKITNATPEMLAELFKRIADERSAWVEENTCEPLPELVNPRIDLQNSITTTINIPNPVDKGYYKDSEIVKDGKGGYEEWPYYTDDLSDWPRGSVDVIIDQNQKFWFYGYRIAEILRYRNCRRVVALVCKHQQVLSSYSGKCPDGGNVIVSESDVVRLIGYAQGKDQEKIKYDFADWLFDTALPKLRNQYCYPRVDSNKPLSEKLRDYAEILEKTEQLRDNILNDVKKS